MGMAVLSKAQISTLQYLSQSPIYSGPLDPCLNALGRRGLATWRRAYQRYGRDNWQITDAGRAALAALDGEK